MAHVILDKKGVFRMNGVKKPDEWGHEEKLIVDALNNFPVSEEARVRARRSLLKNASFNLNNSDDSGLRTLQPEVAHSSSPPSFDLTGRRRYTRRRLLAWAGFLGAAAVVLALVTVENIFRPVNSAQLIAVCIESLEQAGDWLKIRDINDSVPLEPLQNVLNRVLAVTPDSSIEYRPLGSSAVSSRGSLWKLAISGRREVYVLEFENPRHVEGVSARIELLSGISRGWSMAAVVEGDRLFVFMSKERLKDSLNLSPLV
jgi:hypothetical protein